MLEELEQRVRLSLAEGKTRKAAHLLESARRDLLAAGDVDALIRLLDLAAVLPAERPSDQRRRERLLYAIEQNIGFISRRGALARGEEWRDPLQSRRPTTPATPLAQSAPLPLREKLIGAAIATALVIGIASFAALDRWPQRVTHAFACSQGTAGSPSWSPDGREIAIAKDGKCDTQIVAVSVADGSVRPVTTGFGEQPVWSPDGRQILFHSRHGFALVPAAGGKPQLIRADDTDMGAAWSADGTRIAFTHGLPPGPGGDYQATLYVMERDGSGVRRLIGHGCNPGTPAWSPTGAGVAFGCADGLYVIDSGGNGPRRVAKTDFGFEPPTPSWSPDGRVIAVPWGGIDLVESDGSGHRFLEGTVRLHPFRPGEGRLLWDQVKISLDDVDSVAWSPDGRRLAFSIPSGDDKGLYLIRRDGRDLRRLASLS